MSLDTILHASLVRPVRHTTALVLMGGGARTAYQVGVLRALGAILQGRAGSPRAFPFQVLVGTSAGAINAASLAGYAHQGLYAFERLAQFWGALESSGVYRLTSSRWTRFNKLAAAWSLTRHARSSGAILDNQPLVETLRQSVSLSGIEESLRTRAIDAFAVTASSYSSGVHWTFCHTTQDSPQRAWARPGRRAEFQPIGIDHLVASSAIPFLFPATRLHVDGHDEFFGDGSMRQVSPLSPAMHLGAQKALIVGVGQPQRSGFTAVADEQRAARAPSLGSIAGHALASVFHDTLQADVDQTNRVTQTLKDLPDAATAVLPYRRVEVMSIQPTQSLDALAFEHRNELPAATRSALSGLGLLRGGGMVTSYLLFEPGFIQTLISMGESDTYARKDELLAFFAES